MPEIGNTKFPYHCASNEGKLNDFDENVRVCIAVSTVHKSVITNNRSEYLDKWEYIAIRSW